MAGMRVRGVAGGMGDPDLEVFFGSNDKTRRNRGAT